MAKYRVETTNGTYEVETEDAPDPRPVTADANKPPTEPHGSAVKRFAGGFWDTTLGGLTKAAKTLYHLATPLPGGLPNLEAIQDMHDVIQSHIDQAKKAKEEWGRGNKTEAIGYGMAAALPLVGPAAAHAGERIGGSAPKFDKFGNMIDKGAAPDIAGGLGEATGLIASSSPKNIVAPATTKVATVVGKLPVPHRLTPEGMYQSALRPSLSKKNLPKVDTEVATGLREGIPINRGGLNKARAAIDDLNASIDEKIKTRSDELGPAISPKTVADRVRSIEPTFEEQVNPKADLKALNKSKQEFIDKHTTDAPYTKVRPGTDEAAGTLVPEGRGVTKIENPLTLEAAQAEKKGTYRKLREKYGELKPAQIEAQKALARGLKEEIASRVSEITGDNLREGQLIDLESQLERTIAREGNKNILGLVPAVMSRHLIPLLETLAIDNPALKSRVAIALSKLRKSAPSAQRIGNAASVIAPSALIGDYPPPLDSPK